MGNTPPMIDVELNKSIYLNWSHSDYGFGQFYFYTDSDEKIHCSNELMSKDFIKQVLCQMVDDCILDEPR